MCSVITEISDTVLFEHCMPKALGLTTFFFVLLFIWKSYILKFDVVHISFVYCDPFAFFNRTCNKF